MAFTRITSSPFSIYDDLRAGHQRLGAVHRAHFRHLAIAAQHLYPQWAGLAVLEQPDLLAAVLGLAARRGGLAHARGVGQDLVQQPARGGAAFQSLGGRGVTQGGVGHQQRILAPGGGDLRRGGHARAQLELIVGHLEDGEVGHHVVLGLGAQADPGHLGREVLAGPGIHVEHRLLAGVHLAHIGLVHVHLQFHAAQVFGDGEQHRGCHGSGHGLTRLHLAGQHHPVDGGAHGGLGEADFVATEFGPGREHRRFGGLLVGHGAQGGGLCRVQIRPGGNLAARKPGQFLEAGQIGLGFHHGGLALGHLGLGRGQAGAGLAYLILEFGSIQPGHHLAFAHTVVHLHQHAFEHAGKFAAHIHLGRGVEGAGGVHPDHQFALLDGLGAKNGPLGAAVPAQQGHQPQAGKGQGRTAAQQQAATPGPGAGGLDQIMEAGSGMGGRRFIGRRHESCFPVARSVAGAGQPPPRAL